MRGVREREYALGSGGGSSSPPRLMHMICLCPLNSISSNQSICCVSVLTSFILYSFSLVRYPQFAFCRCPHSIYRFVPLFDSLFNCGLQNAMTLIFDGPTLIYAGTLILLVSRGKLRGKWNSRIVEFQGILWSTIRKSEYKLWTMGITLNFACFL